LETQGSPIRVRSSGGADARLPSADQTASFTSGVTRNLLVPEQGRDPFRRPTSLGGIVDPAQRLERQCLTGTQAERVVRAAHRQHGRPCRKPLVEI